jgi:hypothetical protein
MHSFLLKSTSVLKTHSEHDLIVVIFFRKKMEAKISERNVRYHCQRLRLSFESFFDKVA